MFNPEESYVVINKFLSKLKKEIEEQATFTWFKTKFVSKKRIDDLLCCIEGSFPEEYKQRIRETGGIGLNGYRAYQRLANIVRRKAFFSSESYSVDYVEVFSQIRVFQSGLKLDFKKLCETNDTML